MKIALKVIIDLNMFSPLLSYKEFKFNNSMEFVNKIKNTLSRL